MPTADRFDFFTRDGVRLACCMWGRGPQFVVGAHWLGGHGGEWRHLAAELDPARTCLVAPDLRCHGGSAGAADRIDTAILAADLVDLANHLTTDRFVLLGHSYGGKVALRAASAAPGRVAGLVLLGAVAPAGAPIARELAEDIFANRHDAAFVAAAFRPMFHCWPAPALDAFLATFALMDENVLRAAFRAAAWTDESREISAVRCPTLVLSGSHDPVYGSAYQQTAVQPFVPSAELRVVAECGHGFFFERPREVGMAVRAFLASLPTA